MTTLDLLANTKVLKKAHFNKFFFSFFFFLLVPLSKISVPHCDAINELIFKIKLTREVQVNARQNSSSLKTKSI